MHTQTLRRNWSHIRKKEEAALPSIESEQYFYLDKGLLALKLIFSPVISVTQKPNTFPSIPGKMLPVLVRKRGHF